MTNIILVDSALRDSQVFVDSCNESTIPFLYSKNTSRNEVLQFLQTKVEHSQIQHLGIAFEKQGSNYTFLNSQPLFQSGSQTINENTQFLIDIINQFQIKNVDFLACETLLDPYWKEFYKVLTENTGAVIGASNNNTGNIQYGGDWVMESTSEDIENVYFNKTIEYYQYLLGATNSHTVIIGDGVIYACGANSFGQLGTGTYDNSNILIPMIMPEGKIPESVHCGGYHTIAIMRDSITDEIILYGCGNNMLGQLGNGTYNNSNILIPMLMPEGKIPESVHCGNDFTIVKMRDLTTNEITLYGCGSNGAGQLGTGIGSNTNILTLMTIPEGMVLKSVSCGFAHTIMKLMDSTTSEVALYGCGYNSNGQLGNGTYDSSNILIPMVIPLGQIPELVICGNSFTVVSTSEKYSYVIEPSANTLKKPIIFFYSCGSEIGSIDNSNNILTIMTNPILTPVSLLSAGGGHIMINMYNYHISTELEIYGQGYNTYGQLGNGNNISSKSFTPVSVPLRKRIESIRCGLDFTVAKMKDLITNEVSIYSCGNNSLGQLGNGTYDSSNILIPMLYSSFTDVLLESTYYPTLSNFSFQDKTFGDVPFNITPPTSNSTGTFTYESSNTNVATISGETITIVGVPPENMLARGRSFTNSGVTITATQAPTNEYTSGTIVAELNVSRAIPTLSNFSIPGRRYGETIVITPPTSNSTGTFSYESSNTNVATISEDTITFIREGTVTITAIQQPTLNYTSATISTTVNVTCFKEGTKILTDKGYLPIESLRKGDLIQTVLHGFVPIDMIGKSEIYHHAVEERTKEQLYKCTSEKYPEVFEDLIITGCHSILVEGFVSEYEKRQVISVNGNTYVTDNRYRLPACVDEKTTVYEIPGKYTIYHLALENSDYYMNYGIYANGLLVETCSKRYLKEISGMELIE